MQNKNKNSTAVINGKLESLIEASWLVLHPSFRCSGFATLLISELSHYATNNNGILSAVCFFFCFLYTSVFLDEPGTVDACSATGILYMYRQQEPPVVTTTPDAALSPSLTVRALAHSDASTAAEFYNHHCATADAALAIQMSVPQFAHWFTPREGIVDSWLVFSRGVLSGFMSVYFLTRRDKYKHESLQPTTRAHVWHHATAPPLSRETLLAVVWPYIVAHLTNVATRWYCHHPIGRCEMM
eukprot:TRINITY_DN3473_c0_g1_i1.p1 TRINITY_DN3473_c0_g1~~TRINITY_DN3473_c0_g1_i1.p1  ORF type:complete len:242 (+),score=54.75 TRINITY_DN3473_c0_g1_i1:415-1140(+)